MAEDWRKYIMVKLIDSDIRYAIYSRIAIGISGLFLLFSALTLFMTYQKAESSYKQYINQYSFFKQTGQDIDAELEKEPIVTQDGNVFSVENPLPYFKTDVCKSIYSLSSKGCISLFCEQSLMFFPIIAAFMGVIWSNTDIKHKTLRNRVLRNGKIKSHICRQISGFVILLALMFIFLLLFFIAQKAINSYFLAGFKGNISDFTYSPKKKNVFFQFIVAVSSILFYYEMGFSFGSIFKGNPIISILVCIYALFIPPLISYDITNIFSNIGNNVFEFAGAFSEATVKDTSIPIGICILTVLFATMLVLDINVIKKRSAYV